MGGIISGLLLLIGPDFQESRLRNLRRTALSLDSRGGRHEESSGMHCSGKFAFHSIYRLRRIDQEPDFWCGGDETDDRSKKQNRCRQRGFCGLLRILWEFVFFLFKLLRKFRIRSKQQHINYILLLCLLLCKSSIKPVLQRVLLRLLRLLNFCLYVASRLRNGVKRDRISQSTLAQALVWRWS